MDTCPCQEYLCERVFINSYVVCNKCRKQIMHYLAQQMMILKPIGKIYMVLGQSIKMIQRNREITIE